MVGDGIGEVDWFLVVGEEGFEDAAVEGLVDRVGGDESEPLINVLARLIHNQVGNKIYKISGSALGLYTPMDLISFKYKTPKNWIPINLSMDIVGNKSELIIAEPTNENATII